MKDAHEQSLGFRRHRLWWIEVKNNKCPFCNGELDTGWECNSCGADWQDVALMPEPKPEDFTDAPIDVDVEEYEEEVIFGRSL